MTTELAILRVVIFYEIASWNWEEKSVNIPIIHELLEPSLFKSKGANTTFYDYNSKL